MPPSRKFLLLILIVISSVPITPKILAAENEILVSHSSTLGDSTSSVLRFTRHTRTFALAFGYGRLINERIEGVAKAQLFLFDTDYSRHDTAILIGVGPRLNFPRATTGIANAAFVGASLGFADFGRGYGMKFAYDLEVGKRFPLGRGFTFSPTITYGKILRSTGAFAVVPVAFSWLL